MKNKDKAEELQKFLEKNKFEDLVSDSFILGEMGELIDNIEDRKLKLKLDVFFEELVKEFKERDLEEEAKVEFYCSRCEKILPISKKFNDDYLDICEDCLKKEEEGEE